MNLRLHLITAVLFATALVCPTPGLNAAGNIIEYANDKSIDSRMMTGKVILDFYAPWCGPCKTLTPRLHRVAGNHPEVTVIKVDIDKHSSISGRYHVNSVPTLIFLQDGSVKGRVVGSQTEGQLENLIKQHLS